MLTKSLFASLLLSTSLCLSAPAETTTPTASTPGVGEYSVAGEDGEHDGERKEVEDLMNNLEAAWNKHDLDAVMSNYADDYTNNDGIDKSIVAKLTKEFWSTYPDARAQSKTKQIRVEGNFATVYSRDTTTGTNAREIQGSKMKGELQSVSEGQLYLKKLSNVWKIIGDRVDYEKVKVAFGLAKELNTTFTAPEQMKAGKQFSARLEVTLPPGLNAVGSISSQPLRYPQPSATEGQRVLDHTATLERILHANSENCNELLSARVILTDPTREKVLGYAHLTRRLNVVPEALPATADEIASSDAREKSEEKAQKADEKTQNSTK